MHFYEAGSPDDPVVLLLHGLPVSAYFWRNVMPYLEDGHHVIALDHIGFGKSARPDGLTYGLEDQVAYLDAFIQAKGLEDLTLVGQDLGSWTAMTWASRNPDEVRAIALVEGIVPPLLPASTATTDPNLLGIWQAARDPATAEQMFVDDHFFLETVLPQFTACGPTDEALAVYAEPWSDPASRHILYATPAEIPIDGVPATHVETIDAYIDWIGTTDVPKLFVHASPGALMTADVIAGAKAEMRNLTTVDIGGGIHFLAESKPDAVGAALSSWLDAELP
jgi:haloalkane dehalogenase